ncbi:MAG: hypothetical protein ACRDJ1_03275 [Actinomycetota bacterium]
MEAIEPQTVTEERPPRSEQPTEGKRDEPGLRFEDPYWDDAFCAWWDPTLRTCC